MWYVCAHSVGLGNLTEGFFLCKTPLDMHTLSRNPREMLQTITESAVSS